MIRSYCDLRKYAFSRVSRSRLNRNRQMPAAPKDTIGTQIPCIANTAAPKMSKHDVISNQSCHFGVGRQRFWTSFGTVCKKNAFTCSAQSNSLASIAIESKNRIIPPGPGTAPTIGDRQRSKMPSVKTSGFLRPGGRRFHQL